MLGQTCNIHSTPMENTQPGKSPAIRSPDTSTTSTEVRQFSTFPQPPSEDKLKTTTSSSPNRFGTGTPPTVKSHGTPATSPSSTPTTLSASISKKPTASSEVNAKEETSHSKKDGLSLKSKRTTEPPFSEITKPAKPDRDFMVTSTH